MSLTRIASDLPTVELEHREPAPARRAEVTGTDTVRALLARHPAAAAVLERHGLMGCGGHDGPDERIDLFASIHHIPLGSLLAELEEAIAHGHDSGGEVARPDAVPMVAPVHLYRPFLAASLGITFTLGATFGAWNLLLVHLALGANPPVHNAIHAAFQLLGFVLLFTMGVSYHALPRFLGHPLAGASLARASLPLMLAGLLLRSYGQIGALVPGALPALLLGSLLVAASIVCWAGVLASTLQRAKPRPALFLSYLGAGTAWWVAAGGLLLLGAADALRAGDVDAATGINEAFYAAALFGGALSWILGMTMRTLPAFLSLPRSREPFLRLGFVLAQAGTALVVAAKALPPFSQTPLLHGLGLLALSSAIVSAAIGLRVFARRDGRGAELAPPEQRGFGMVMRLAFGFACLFALLAAHHAMIELDGELPPRLLFDGARHAFGLGFVTLAILGMAGRIVPIFGGVDLPRPRLHLAGCLLIATAVVLRQAQVVAAFGGPAWLLGISGTSGLLGALGVVLAGSSILGALRREQGALTPSPGGRVPVDPEVNVAALVEAHPEALPLLVEAGFTPLANPLLRATVARAVSLRQACAMHGIPLEPLLVRLRGACHEDDGAAAERKGPPAPAIPPDRGDPADDRSAAILGMLTAVVDPALQMNIVDMGLVYGAAVEADGSIRVRMTLASSGCPQGARIPDEVRRTLAVLPGVPEVHVDVVFDPPWSSDRIRPGARLH